MYDKFYSELSQLKKNLINENIQTFTLNNQFKYFNINENGLSVIDNIADVNYLNCQFILRTDSLYQRHEIIVLDAPEVAYTYIAPVGNDEYTAMLTDLLVTKTLVPKIKPILVFVGDKQVGDHEWMFDHFAHNALGLNREDMPIIDYKRIDIRLDQVEKLKDLYANATDHITHVWILSSPEILDDIARLIPTSVKSVWYNVPGEDGDGTKIQKYTKNCNIFEIDIYFNPSIMGDMTVGQRIKDIEAIYKARDFPLYGTFGNSLNQRTIDNFYLGEDAVDFTVLELDLVSRRAKIEWRMTKQYCPESFDGLNLCLAYMHNHKNVTELRYAFLQQKSESKHRNYEIPADAKDEDYFDFGVALRAMKEGQPITRKAWHSSYGNHFISCTPGTDSLPAERFWSQANRGAAVRTDNKVGNVRPYTTKWYNGSVEPYFLTNEDLYANDWKIDECALRHMNNLPDDSPGEDICNEAIHCEDVCEDEIRKNNVKAKD